MSIIDKICGRKSASKGWKIKKYKDAFIQKTDRGKDGIIYSVFYNDNKEFVDFERRKDALTFLKQIKKK